MAIRHMDNGNFAPVKQVITQTSAEDDGQTDPSIECHESEHKGIGQNDLDQV